MHRSLSARTLARASLVSGLLAGGCADPGGRPASPSTAIAAAPSPKLAALARQDADAFLAVDCKLPPQVRKLGRQVSFLSGQRVVKTAAGDCETRGGEYVAYDRADLATALSFWMPDAQAGDAKAQTYVGELFERGIGGARPDHASAAL
jgi:TPR repeat protein